MVKVPSRNRAAQALKRTLGGFLGIAVIAIIAFSALYASCTSRVAPNEWGVEQSRLGTHTGIRDTAFGPGLYFLGPGITMHHFDRDIQVLEATRERDDLMKRTSDRKVHEEVIDFFRQRDALLGPTHRVTPALTIQTSDGYAVDADVTLLYSIADPVRIAREFGWGTMYIDSFVINTFRNGVLATLGKMNTESFYSETARLAALKEAEDALRDSFGARGLKVERLLLRNYTYSPNYERSLHDKKVAVQMTEKNKKESLVNEERAKLKQIESKGNATITIAESEVNAQISKVRAEAELYSSQQRARADRELGFAEADAKRMKAEALNHSGGRYVVALETAKMFESIEGAVMTPEQYIAFIRSAWGLIGLNGSAAPAPAGKK